VRKTGAALPAKMRENETTVARAAGQLRSRPLGSTGEGLVGSTMVLPHWDYFMTIEADLSRAFAYVEPNEENFGTYSVEFVKVLLTASSEVEVVATLLCKSIQSDYHGSGIGSLRKVILDCYPKFPSLRIQVPRSDLEVEPWASWAHNSNPDWWNAYNSVKHKRYRHFKDANLGNVLMSMSGLFALLLYLYHNSLEEIVPASRLFSVRPHPMMPFSKTRYALPDFEY